jgi:hypothetical protein
MRTFRTVAVVAGLALVLSACGLFSGLVPDQTLTNPLGLDGNPVSLSAVTTVAVTTQATDTLSGPFSGSFGNFDASSIPSGIGPNGFNAPIDIETTATITTATPGALPTTFSLTGVQLSLTVADGSGNPSFTLSPEYSHTGTLLNFTQSGCTASSCSYDVAAGPDLGTALIALALSSSDVNTLWTIVTGGSTPNTVQGTISVTLDQVVPDDAAIAVTLVSPTGTLTF